MRMIFLAAAVAVAGCNVDTMSAAGTAASLKKQELEQSKATMQQAQQKIGRAVEQMNQSAKRAEDDGIK